MAVLIEVCEALTKTGLRDAGYVYISPGEIGFVRNNQTGQLLPQAPPSLCLEVTGAAPPDPGRRRALGRRFLWQAAVVRLARWADNPLAPHQRYNLRCGS